jgi:ubiquinol-cytochrome c reductase cytochrome b subunit
VTVLGELSEPADDLGSARGIRAEVPGALGVGVWPAAAVNFGAGRVLVPALIVPGVFFTLLAAYPFIEGRLTGDRGLHLLPDRPRDAATRTGAGVAGITFYGVLWAAAANDQIAYHFHLDLYTVTWVFRVAAFIGPVLAFVLARRICLGLSSRAREETEHGHETGRIVMSPEGGFSEIIEPVPRARPPVDPRAAVSRADR